MSKLSIVLLALVALIVGSVGICVGSYVSWANYGNRTEAALDASYTDNQNLLATYTTKISEIAQVPEMYKGDLKEIIDSTFKGRYGQDGSKAVFQFIKEQNLNLDPSMYKEIQNQMIAGRDKFQNAQSSLIDQVRSYKTNLGNVWSGLWLRMAGYPKVDLKKYDPVINNYAEKAFATKRDEGIQLLKK